MKLESNTLIRSALRLIFLILAVSHSADAWQAVVHGGGPSGRYAKHESRVFKADSPPEGFAFARWWYLDAPIYRLDELNEGTRLRETDKEIEVGRENNGKVEFGAIFAKVETAFLEDGEPQAASTGILFPKRDSDPEKRYAFKIRVEIDRSGMDDIDPAELFDRLSVGLSWFPDTIKAPDWHSDEIAEVWTKKTGGSKLTRDNFINRDLFSRAQDEPSVFTVILYYKPLWDEDDLKSEENPSGKEKPPYLNISPRLSILSESTNWKSEIQRSSLALLTVEIVPDWNRDGKIDLADRGKVADEKPFRWWINDDNDLTIAERGENTQDIPNQIRMTGTGLVDDRDCSDFVADGMRDQIDFFPVHLDLKAALEALPESDYKYVLKHEEEALKFHEYPPCIIDGSDPGRLPNRHVKMVGVGRGLATKELKLTSTQGTELSAVMLSKAKEGNGVIVIEGAKKTEKPLVLEILKKSDNSSVAEIEFPIRIVNVEDMYRHVNMRDVMEGSGGHPTQITEPSGYPDELTNGKYVAYVHGFNVSGESARGSQSNIFKRLYQLGSKARFIGVSWYGNPPNRFNNLTPPDYHRAVYNGLTTGIVARTRLGFTQDSELTVLAHSLGNSVVGSAIAYHGLKVNHYYIINGAIPLQAYDSAQTSNSSGDPDMKRNMTEDDWKPYYDYGNNGFQHRLFAANWHELFASNPTDNRNKLTWKDIFATPELLNIAYNFYSPSDEVVENPDDSEEAGDWDNVRDAAFGGGRHAWVSGEIAKGGQNIAIAGYSFHDINGGWKFNQDWDIHVSDVNWRRSPEETISITDEELRKNPFHSRFFYLNLYDPAQGSATAGVTTNRYKMLATGIPAMSYAIAANALEPFEPSIGGGLSKNFNMPQELRSAGGYSSWPAHGNANNPEDWMHSDFKDVAFHFLHPMYQKMIDLAELDKD
ncbi:hypothetical protein [Haloferula sp.]|uniref:hypothetical protein n=1 Tax=Haloferula sp. TaxID=2497595 RepID=UPI003C7850C6